ncbi:GHKL domain-containing protein, partial [Candidatus Poribacteria bacterium]|nr:GHKL domain-containing protein [Candidatus Poribacteria bacterium]
LSMLHARMRYKYPDHRQEAIAQLRSLIEMYEELGDFDRIHDAFFMLGSIYDDKPEDSDLAIEAYKRGLQLSGKTAEVHNNLGVLYSQKGLMDAAIKEFHEAIKLDLEYESPYRNLAKVYFYLRNEEIAKEFQLWINETPDKSAKILFNLSLALMDIGRAEACESIYSKTHRIKNLIGVTGAKLRRLYRELDSDDFEARLLEIYEDQEKCYKEMVSLLSTMKHDDLLLTMVDINSTIDTIIRQTGFKPDNNGNLLFSGRDLNNIRCVVSLVGNLPSVKGDQGKLKEAFSNIIINAIEAMPQGGKLIISTEYSEKTSEVEIVLQDNGIGISSNDLDNIFKPGYTTKESGSGFGLSIVERIIKEHKGRINVVSSKGEGSTIRIHLPVNLELAPIQTSLRMRPVIYEDPGELISTEVDKILRL